jgi:hypothetical protein
MTPLAPIDVYLPEWDSRDANAESATVRAPDSEGLASPRRP